MITKEGMTLKIALIKASIASNIYQKHCTLPGLDA